MNRQLHGSNREYLIHVHHGVSKYHMLVDNKINMIGWVGAFTVYTFSRPNWVILMCPDQRR